MTTHTFDYDLIVIGSGAGGSVAATIAAREGLRVAIVEESILGGDSSNWGDVPTKALLHTAHLYDETKRGDRFGLRTTSLGYNYPSIRAWKEKVVKQTGVGDNKKFYEDQGITVFMGKAHFLTPHEITVNRRHLSGHRFLIATGSEWIAPNIQGLSDVTYFTPRTILETIRPPK
ncbi:NAD(P)/FAD-dependent oxidoreductase, partial [Candidatus Saccharibacteria bacterium]|nr:NAD(P)/FAD-dependent oxidoreductase [Candidatus Saccharibacteria bacterium]